MFVCFFLLSLLLNLSFRFLFAAQHHVPLDTWVLAKRVHILTDAADSVQDSTCEHKNLPNPSLFLHQSGVLEGNGRGRQ